MPRIKDQAICIRRADWSETSQIVTLLTQAHGIVHGLAKGSKRTSPGAVARYSGGIELLTLGQIVGIVKATTDLATLTEWDLQNPYWHLRQNLATQRLALYAADLVRAFLADLDPHPVVYDALEFFLNQLAEPARRGEALLSFQWRLLTDCGYQPRLDHDVLTAEIIDLDSIQGTYFFDPLAAGVTRIPSGRPRNRSLEGISGGGVSGGSGGSGGGRWGVRPATVALLQTLGTNDAGGPKSPPDPDTVWRANRLLCHYAAVLLDRQLPTMVWVIRDRPDPGNPGSPG